ncbi:LPS-assembly protein LptD [Pelagovum pacificum]|nr:LPS assembly protein LptD [Pelagovum pacificum]
MRASRLLPLVLALLCAALQATAQGTATMVADNIVVTENRRLVATGNVEAFYDGTRLSAQAITYDEPSDSLTITGPIFILAENGNILTAEQGSLDPKLENGILRSARLVLQEQLQLAANQIDRVEGRYTQLYGVAATACRICGNGPPLWEIRARRVIHDQDENQLYFENAQFRLAGIPILYLPRMRLPDPELERSAGLLIPELRTTDRLGTGVKLPYFIPLGPSADVTLAPYISANTTTLEARYRQAFLTGDLTFEGAFTEDDLTAEPLRSYGFLDADFALPGRWMLDAQMRFTSDDTYLLDYDYSDADRLDSFVTATRITEDQRLSFGVTVTESLRPEDVNRFRPTVLPDAYYEQVLRFPGLPGRVTVRADSDGAFRRSSLNIKGRDVTRIGTGIEWRVDRILGPGVVSNAMLGVDVDRYGIDQDDTFDTPATRSTPYAMAELRWPLSRTAPGGTVHVIEPVVALTWSETDGPPVPNEDSRVVEFDETNLFFLSRFPGEDAREDGLRAAAALGWTALTPGGWSSNFTAGRLFRMESDPRFQAGTGLDGENSDWVTVLGIEAPSGLSFDARALFDDDFTFSRTEARLMWENNRTDLAATFVQLSENAAEAREDEVSEFTFDGAFQLTRAWEVLAEGRYDVVAEKPKYAGIGAEYSNECITVGLSVSRRFTSSTTLEPETDYGITVALNGFSAGRSDAPVTRSCRN